MRRLKRLLLLLFRLEVGVSTGLADVLTSTLSFCCYRCLCGHIDEEFHIGSVRTEIILLLLVCAGDFQERKNQRTSEIGEIVRWSGLREGGAGSDERFLVLFAPRLGRERR